MSSARLDRLTVALQRYVDEGRLPGVVAMVLRDGKVVYSEAIGDLDPESGTSMGTDAIFRIASPTKALVSVGIMMLQESGALLISDRVSRYVPAFTNTVAVPNHRGGVGADARRLLHTQVGPAVGLDDHNRLRSLVYSAITESASH